MTETEQPTPANAIALASAAIGVVSGLASGAVGYEHAKSLYEAAAGSEAGLSDYLSVGQAFWDGIPIAAAVAFLVGALAYGVWNSGLFYGAGAVGLGALAFASSYDPDHLLAYQQTVLSGETTTAGLLGLWSQIYGPLATVLAVIAGVGVGYAGGLKLKEA